MGSLATPSRSAHVRVLDWDPDLAAGLAPDEACQASESVRAPSEVIEIGTWRPEVGDGPCLGLLVLDGLICRSVAVANRSSQELLGAGDLLRPWDPVEGGVVPCSVEWQVLERARIAYLDESFAAAIAPWPQINAELLERAVKRSRSQAVFAAISHMTRVDQRLLLAFWHFADRLGRVRLDGVVVRLPLTHEDLGALVGARRPSVTSALGTLADRGLVRPLLRGEWLLTAAAAEAMSAS